MILRKALLGWIAMVGALATSARADVVTAWNDELLSVLAQEKQSPPQVSRALAMLHVAVYDAVNSIDRTHAPYRIQRNPAAGTSIEAAAAQAAFEVAFALFPAHLSRFDKLLNSQLASVPEGAGKTAGIRLGEDVARQIIAWRATDGANVSKAHSPSLEAGKWRKTAPNFQDALLPQWATLVPFAMEKPSEFRQPGPPDMASEAYGRDFEEVKRLGSANSTSRTEEETAIARFWEDGPGTVTPPGRWNRIAQTIAQQRRNTLVQNARLFALLNIALADAAISCWDMKYEYNCWRPITAIQHADADGNPTTEPDSDWEPLLSTPPFPSCSSGHSTFSAAGAWILILFYETLELPVSVTNEQGATRTFKSVGNAALEAGRSRVLGGIHFEFENKKGIKAGEDLSKFVFVTYLSPVSESGTTPSPADRDAGATQESVAESEPNTSDAAEPDLTPVSPAPSAAPPAVAAISPEACEVTVLRPMPPLDICIEVPPGPGSPSSTAASAPPASSPSPAASTEGGWQPVPAQQNSQSGTGQPVQTNYPATAVPVTSWYTPWPSTGLILSPVPNQVIYYSWP